MPETMLHKFYTAKLETDEADRTVTAVISTDGIDRDGEVLLPKGADFEKYLKNPVVLWAHDYHSTPIGKALWIRRGRKNGIDSIMAKIQFIDAEISLKAEEVYQLFKGGFLNAFSVGFLPKDGGSHTPTPDEIKKRPDLAEAHRIYDQWELLEFSAVPVPANPEALAVAVKSKELNLTDETLEDMEMDLKAVEVKEKKLNQIIDLSVADDVELKQTAVMSRSYKLRPVGKMKIKPDVREQIKELASDEMKKAKGIVFS